MVSSIMEETITINMDKTTFTSSHHQMNNCQLNHLKIDIEINKCIEWPLNSMIVLNSRCSLPMIKILKIEIMIKTKMKTINKTMIKTT
jgi:hypothetical protein